MLTKIKHNILIRQILVRPRLFMAGFVGVLVAMLLPPHWVHLEITRLLVGWNTGACLYLLLSAWMIAKSSHEKIQLRACAQDDGQIVILIVVILAAIASVAAIITELAEVKSMTPVQKFPHILLSIFTIIFSWAFTHMMFALHYAHDFYVSRSKGENGGLDFPSEHKPHYMDFVYFSYVIGTSGQTADVSITNKAMRNVGLVHCILSFLFNTTVLALMINIAASLF